MCFGGSGDSKELQIAREQAAKAKAQADIALAQAQAAVAQAKKAGRPVVDQEAARKAGENAMRTKVAEGTYTKNFLGGAGVNAPSPSIAYATLLHPLQKAA